MDSLSVAEGVENVVLCASVVNPNLFNASMLLQLVVVTLNSSAQGKLSKMSVVISSERFFPK